MTHLHVVPKPESATLLMYLEHALSEAVRCGRRELAKDLTRLVARERRRRMRK